MSDEEFRATAKRCTRALAQPLTSAVAAAIECGADDPIHFVGKRLLGSLDDHPLRADPAPYLPARWADLAPAQPTGWTVISWLQSLQIERAVAPTILGHDAAAVQDDELSLMLRRAASLQSRNAVVEFMRSDAELLERVADEVWLGICELRGRQSAADSGATSRAEQPPADRDANRFAGFELTYASTRHYFGGLASIVGQPSPRVHEGMRLEHCGKEDARIVFRAPNYGTTTTSEVEWHFCAATGAEPAEAAAAALSACGFQDWPAEERARLSHGRSRRPLEAFDGPMRDANEALAKQDEAPLRREECLALRLYTGPLFVKYNGVLRGLTSTLATFRSQREALCKSNRYPTTLHAISSSIVKLSKLTRVGVVYRGVADGRLPSEFSEPDRFGVRGGVEPAFLSTTREREVALAYGSGGASGGGVLFAIRQTMTCRGADVSSFSQYPHEAECLFPPQAALEIVGPLYVDGRLTIVDVSPSVNAASATLEKLLAHRHGIVKAMADTMADELRAALCALLDDTATPLALLEAAAAKELAGPAEAFNEDEHFLSAVSAVVGAKRSALCLGMLSAGVPTAELVEQGYDGGQLREAGASARQLYEAGYTISQLVDSGFALPDLRPTGARVWEYRQAGLSAVDVSKVGFSAHDFRGQGYSAQQLIQASQGGWSWMALNLAGFNEGEIRAAGCLVPRGAVLQEHTPATVQMWRAGCRRHMPDGRILDGR